MTVTPPVATPIGWDPVTAVSAVTGPAPRQQPTLFDVVTVAHGTAGRSALDAATTDQVRQLAVVTIEVLSGRRSPAQLARWTTEGVQAQLTMAARRVRGRVPMQVASVHPQALSPAVIETVLRVRIPQRSIAMAFRLQRRQGRWRCTAWDLRPDDLLASSAATDRPVPPTTNGHARR